MEKAKNPRKTIFFIALSLFAVALFFRLQYLNHTFVVNPIRADATGYANYAYNLANHNTFSDEFGTDTPTPDSYCSPGYPLFLSVFFKFFGDGFYPWALYAQALLSALMVVLVFIWAICFMRIWAAFAAGVLTAFSPHLVTMSGLVLTETLFGFVLLAACVCFQYAQKTGKSFLYAGAGLVFGYAYLTNETALFLPFLLAGAVLAFRWFSSGNVFKGRLVVNLVLFILVFCLFPFLWSWRNHVSVPPGASTGQDRAISSVALGSYPGFMFNGTGKKFHPNLEDPLWSEYESSTENFIRIFKQRFKQRPVRYVAWYLFEKPYYFWRWALGKTHGDTHLYEVSAYLYESSKIAALTKKTMRYLHPAVLILAISGIPLFFVLIRRKRDFLFYQTPVPALVVIASATLLYMVFQPLPRYSIPYRPQLYVFASWALAAGLQGRGYAYRARYAIPLAVVCVLAVLTTAMWVETRGFEPDNGPSFHKSDLACANSLKYRKEARSAMEENNPQKALALYREALRILPGDAGALEDMGLGLLMAGQPPEAAAYLAEAWAADQKNARVLNSLGLALYKSGNGGQGVRIIRESLKIDPGLDSARRNLTEIESRVGRVIEQLKDMPADDPKVQATFGEYYYILAEYNKAVFHFEQALVLKPDLFAVANTLGGVLVEKGEYDKALAIFIKILDAVPDDIEARYNMARLFAAKGDEQEAGKWLDKAVAAGFSDIRSLVWDLEFDKIRNSPDFMEFFKKRASGSGTKHPHQ